MADSLIYFFSAVKRRQVEGFSLEAALLAEPEDNIVVHALKVIERGTIEHPAYSESDLIDWASAVAADEEGVGLIVDPGLLEVGKWIAAKGIDTFPAPLPLNLRLAVTEAYVLADPSERTHESMFETLMTRVWE